MKIRWVAATVLVWALAGVASPQGTASKEAVTFTRGSGGSIQTKLSSNIIVNKNSSLTREWITMHDPAMPLDLVGTIGVTTAYVPDRVRGEYQYQAKFSVQATVPVSAFEVRFLTFDLWGQHVRNLVSDDVSDIEPGTKEVDAQWRLYSENDCSRHYASIAYVSRVRTRDGRVLEADPAPVVQEAKKFSKKFTAADLEPKPEAKQQ